MAKYLIWGGRKLSGSVRISGNKNSILPLLSASLLTNQLITLENVPNIFDVKVFLEILQSLGSVVDFSNHTIKIQTKKITGSTINQELSRKIRASILLLGPLLSRVGHISFHHPGGDLIGLRSIDQHLTGLEALGIKFKIKDQFYQAEKKLASPKDYFLDEPSVTATENLIMYSVLGEGQLTLKNCATEPNIQDLCQLLNRMGAKIEGIGNSTLKITRVRRLHGSKFRVGPDYLEIGTYAVAAAITSGAIKLENCSLKDLEAVTKPLQKMGVVFQDNTVSGQKLQAIPVLKTNIWPNFPTDLMSLVIVLASQARGVSLLHDWMYESRMYFVDKLTSMGAKITIADPHRVIVSGPNRLKGRNLETPDIRAGMALVLAALVAKGESTIERSELIERGYEDVVGKLQKLGAKIQRVD